MIKIYYPTMSFLPLNERKNTWYPYLLKGFQQIGQVILSEEMSEISAYKKGEAITVFDVEIEGKKRRVFYDWTDFMVDNRERAKSHNALYFKIQAYDDLLPIGQTVTSLAFFEKLYLLRKLKDIKRYPYDVIGVFRTRRGENGQRRINSVKITKNIEHCKSFIGLSRRSPLHEVPEDLLMAKIDYMDYLVKQAQTKLSLVWAGVGNANRAFSWRLTESLGVGNAIITHKHDTIFPNHDYFEKNCVIIVNSDLSDLKEKIEYYMRHDEEREVIAKNGREYFDKYLTPKAMASNIIEVIKNER